MKTASPDSPAHDDVPDDPIAAALAVAGVPDDEIDTGDPDAPALADWSEAERGRFYRPRKVQKTLRIDADVLAFFEAQGPGHLTRMNQALREEMLRVLRRRDDASGRAEERP